jgi:ubiquinone/menaquinone biosynthesis C-methylase UbiE
MTKEDWEKLSETDWSIDSDMLKKFLVRQKTMFDWLKDVTKGNKKVKILDQGTGIGQYAMACAKLGYRNIRGMDFSEKMLERARKYAKVYKGKNIRFDLGDIRDMPYEDNTFDVIISPGIIEHVEETEKTVEELYRVVKNGGHVLLFVPYKWSLFTLLKKIQQFLGIWKCGYEKSFSEKELEELLKKFVILDKKHVYYRPGKHPWIGKCIQLVDKVCRLFGCGGHHIYFKLKKNKSWVDMIPNVLGKW